MNKKGVFFLLAAIVGAVCAWLMIHNRSSKPESPQPIQPPAMTANKTNPAATQSAVEPVVKTNDPFARRPDSIDEERWKNVLRIRQMMLARNKPIEFYARVLDQTGNPVEGTKLTLEVTRVDETLFATTNFLHHNAGDEVSNVQFKLTSDSNGWFRLAATNGYVLTVRGVSKEGYSSKYSDVYNGMIVFDPNGDRNANAGYGELTNALDPSKGYVFRLQKNEP